MDVLLQRIIWRPSLPVSIDGKPLAVQVSDLYFTFPHDRLPSNTLVALCMQPRVVVAMVSAYVLSKPALKLVVEQMSTPPSKSKLFKRAVAVHNLVLAVFSLVVAVNSWPIVIMEFLQHGFKATYCNQDENLWTSGFGAWAAIFYISKFYEFVDTWILILKGKQPSFLQMYHHVGIVISMWGGVASHSSWLLIVVLLNSVIHTFMYTYFFIKTINPSLRIRAARYLTLAQIGQFVTGILIQGGFLMGGGQCDSPASKFMCAFIVAYAVGLIFLFKAFAAKKYKKE